jgi:hypothetical protein
MPKFSHSNYVNSRTRAGQDANKRERVRLSDGRDENLFQRLQSRAREVGMAQAQAEYVEWLLAKREQQAEA